MKGVLILLVASLAACASGPRMRMGEVVLRPGDRLEVHGRELHVTLDNAGPGALLLTALDGQGRPLQTPWTHGTGEVVVEDPGLSALQVDNFSQETTQVGVSARGRDLSITYRAGTRPERR